MLVGVRRQHVVLVDLRLGGDISLKPFPWDVWLADAVSNSVGATLGNLLSRKVPLLCPHVAPVRPTQIPIPTFVSTAPRALEIQIRFSHALDATHNNHAPSQHRVFLSPPVSKCLF